MDKKLEKLVDRLEMSHELAIFMADRDADERLKKVIYQTLMNWTNEGKSPIIPDFDKIKHYPKREDGPAIWCYRPKPSGRKRSCDHFESYIENFSRYYGLGEFQQSHANKVARVMNTSYALVRAKVNFVEAVLRFNHQRDIWYAMLPNDE